MENTVKIRLIVKGHVQGVFYRQSSCDKANALGLSGWVCNQSDGSVLLEASGTRANLEALISWCEKGPAGARVEHLEVSWLEMQPGQQLDGQFKIRR